MVESKLTPPPPPPVSNNDLTNLYMFDYDPVKLKREAAAAAANAEKESYLFNFNKSTTSSSTTGCEEAKLEVLFSRCEALYAHGFIDHACVLAQLLAHYCLKNSNFGLFNWYVNWHSK